ncbi:hypothetical protein GGD65_007717 [Bradyrhizobium sp. CIR18]|nr:hypothetical protein [Bradyrhizobium sp. CIR18]
MAAVVAEHEGGRLDGKEPPQAHQVGHALLEPTR